MVSYKIYPVKYCEQYVPGPEMFYMSGWESWLNIYFYFWIIDDGNKNILVDTGIRDVNEINPLVESIFGERGKFRMSMEREGIPILLRERGVNPKNVKYVILTHLHYDHASNVKLFPNAQIVVSKKGLLNTISCPFLEMVPHPLFPRDVISYLVNEARDRLILAEDEEITDGISVFWIGGHTMCSQAVKVKTKSGSAVLTGDTVFLYENIEKNVPVGLNVSLMECYTAMKKIRNEADIIIPSHDPKVLERYPTGVIE
ncbi:MAG: N-acyl homoserine lactonase family protein [Candidatus Bathyarchaeia archaeon]